ncbi:hypothetical protein [Yinghuangia soli]|uniref:MobA protein n=1 Tax=Yinghuangia soli TaxID=2908204 RepID=A0AA41PUB9_9ACTN|nr:hypothetical protein [Yinghuangia soli]MCF2526024.1 hypothetical protein [Yinghuangia soli]
MNLDELFERSPWQWGLRGDPHVWAAMREYLRGRPLPDDAFATRRVLEEAFTEVVGVAPQWLPGQDEAIPVAQFRTGSGISDGIVSLHYWSCTAIPLLVDRAGAAKGW